MKLNQYFTIGIISVAALMTAVTPVLAEEVNERLIRLGDLNLPGNAGYLGAVKFVELVGAKSGGKLKIKYFPSSTLGNELQQQAALRGGTQEMFISAPSTLAGIVKDFGLLDLPFTFDSVEMARAVVDGPFGNLLLDKLAEKDIIGLAYWDFGFRNVTNNKRPVTKLEDFKGIKLRVMPNPVFIDTFSALGTNPIPMNMGEVYVGLESKTIDGQENSASVVRAAKLNEVQKYFSITNHCFNANLLQVGKKFWDKLTPTEKKILKEAALEARDYERKVSVEQTKQALDEMKAKGMQVNEVSAFELERMSQKTQPVKEKILKEYDKASVKLFLSEIERLKHAK